MDSRVSQPSKAKSATTKTTSKRAKTPSSPPALIPDPFDLTLPPNAVDPDTSDASTSDESDDTGNEKGAKRAKKASQLSGKRQRLATSPSPPAEDETYLQEDPRDIAIGSRGRRAPIDNRAPVVQNKPSNDDYEITLDSDGSSTLGIHVKKSTASSDAVYINLDVSSLLMEQSKLLASTSAELERLTSLDEPERLADGVSTAKRTVRQEMLDKAKARTARMAAERAKPKGKYSFLILPEQIRNKIYRMVMETDTGINFGDRSGFNGRSAALLRTCRTISEEARVVLYGHNTFHFQRSTTSRGKFWEKTWKEVGWKDVRSFLETIGPHNVALLKFVSFYFSDGNGSGVSHLDDNEKRFVNDPILYQSLRLLGQHVALEKIALTFGGRKKVVSSDYHVLRALSTVKAREVIHAAHYAGYKSKINDHILGGLKTQMTFVHTDPSVNPKSRKPLQKKMANDKPGPLDFQGDGGP